MARNHLAWSELQDRQFAPKEVKALFASNISVTDRSYLRIMWWCQMGFVMLGICGLALARIIDNKPLAIPFMVIPVAGFVTTLVLARRRHANAYKRFIDTSVTDDGIFLYCPSCGYHLRGSHSANGCPECGDRPWRVDMQA